MKIGGSAALIVIGAINPQPTQAGLQVAGVVLMIAGVLGPDPHYQAGAGALPVGWYHPLGVEQDRAGLDELGRIPSELKEKETSWLT
jgi:hypothetical protein